MRGVYYSEVLLTVLLGSCLLMKLLPSSMALSGLARSLATRTLTAESVPRNIHLFTTLANVEHYKTAIRTYIEAFGHVIIHTYHDS